MAPWDVSSPTTVVGDGTPASCTAAALQAAATIGGVIVFDCGAAPVTITVTSPIMFTKATVLDGGGLVTLSGGGASRILYLDSAYDQTTPRLVVQRLTFRDGRSAAGGDDTAVGGGAIYRDGGSLTVIDCTFVDNHAPSPGQDIAGGAIYGFGGGDTVIAGSTFTDNAASNGGAVGSLNGDLTIINSMFTGNAATGTGGNPGNGGCGGAIYMDGADELTTLCGVTIANNTAGAIGGGFFRVSNDHIGTVHDGPHHGRREPGDAARLAGTRAASTCRASRCSVTDSTISRNQAFYNGGIWIHTSDVQMTNVTIAENTAFGSNGGGLWLSNLRAGGTLLNCTIANNHSTAKDQIAGAIFGVGPHAEEHAHRRQHRDVGPRLQRDARAAAATSSGRTTRAARRRRWWPTRCSARSATTAATPRRWSRPRAAPRADSAPAARRPISAACRVRSRAPPAPSRSPEFEVGRSRTLDCFELLHVHEILGLALARLSATRSAAEMTLTGPPSLQRRRYADSKSPPGTCFMKSNRSGGLPIQATSRPLSVRMAARVAGGAPKCRKARSTRSTSSREAPSQKSTSFVKRGAP